jgi:hypothetical protein
VHNLTIGNLTVHADPSIRTAAIDESDWPLSELEVYVHKAGASERQRHDQATRHHSPGPRPGAGGLNAGGAAKVAPRPPVARHYADGIDGTAIPLTPGAKENRALRSLLTEAWRALAEGDTERADALAEQVRSALVERAEAMRRSHGPPIP